MTQLVFKEIRFGDVKPGERIVFNDPREPQSMRTLVYTKTKPTEANDHGLRRISEMEYRDSERSRKKRGFCDNQDHIVFLIENLEVRDDISPEEMQAAHVETIEEAQPWVVTPDLSTKVLARFATQAEAEKFWEDTERAGTHGKLSFCHQSELDEEIERRKQQQAEQEAIDNLTCGNCAQQHELFDDVCVASALMQIALNDRGTVPDVVTARTLLDKLDGDRFWNDIGPIIDRLEKGEYSEQEDEGDARQPDDDKAGKYVVNLNTADQCDDGFEYNTLEEAIESAGRLARSCAEHYEQDRIERSVTIFIPAESQDEDESDDQDSPVIVKPAPRYRQPKEHPPVSVTLKREDLESSRATWAKVAKQNGWFTDPFYVQVWIFEDGSIQDSVSFQGMQRDIFVLVQPDPDSEWEGEAMEVRELNPETEIKILEAKS